MNTSGGKCPRFIAAGMELKRGIRSEQQHAVRVSWPYFQTAKRSKPLGAHYTVSSTCYSQGGITSSGASVYFGEVANNFLPLGTRILLDHPAFGRREYQVEDRIGYGSELDIYNPSESACIEYGRREIGFHLIARPRVYRSKEGGVSLPVRQAARRGRTQK